MSQRRADLRPAHRTTLAMQAADQLRRRIVLGDVRPGHRLESSRELARQLGVSLPVVREAIAAVAYAGLVEVRHGVGVFVVPSRRTAARQLGLARRRATPAELHALRATIGAASARSAATRCTARRLAEIHLAREERERAAFIGDEQEFITADLAFHEAVARASGNAIGVAIERAAGVGVAREMAGRATVLALSDHLEDLHGKLAEAIDGRRARDAAQFARRIAVLEADPSDPDGHP